MSAITEHPGKFDAAIPYVVQETRQEPAKLRIHEYGHFMGMLMYSSRRWNPI